MGTQAVNCNNCGAPLEVGEATKYATCGFCGSQLEIRRSGGALYSDVLQTVSHRTAAIAEDLETIRLQNELERLDREWMLERDTYTVRDGQGGSHRPGVAGGVAVLVFGAIFGLFWIGVTMAAGVPCVALFGLVAIGVAVAAGISILSKAGACERAEAAYRSRRHSILRELQARQRGR
jgi:hypothetical protein